MNDFGERIKFIRGDLTQSEFASKIGVSLRSVIFYEKENRIPRDKVLRRICILFGINFNWLKNNKGEIYKNGKTSSNEEVCTTVHTLLNQEKNHHFEIIEENIKPPDFNHNKMCTTVHTFELQQEIITLLKEKMELIQQNSELRLQLKEKEEQVIRLEDEIASLREALKEHAAIQGGNKREAG